MLIAMSILGVKFYPAMLEYFDNNNPQEFERIIEKLVGSGFITQLNNLAFEFKSNSIWKIIVSIVCITLIVSASIFLITRKPKDEESEESKTTEENE